MWLKLRLRMYVPLEPIGLSPLPSLSQVQFIPLRNCCERPESVASPKESPTVCLDQGLMKRQIQAPG
jgi:hypothetical protein